MPLLRGWLLALMMVLGCKHDAPRSSASASKPAVEVGMTAVGAYLEQPLPHLVAMLAACSFTGPVSKDVRVTASGSISAQCPEGVLLHWTAVPASSLEIMGPPTIRLPQTGLDYLFEAKFVVGERIVGGRAEVEWATDRNCDRSADVRRFALGIFVLPKSAGSCTLRASSPLGLHAERTIVIE